MEEKLLKLKNDLQEILKKDEIIVDDINLEKKGNYNFLTITLDKIEMLANYFETEVYLLLK